MGLENVRVGVLAGGISSEREISLLSGKQVFSILKKRGANAVFIDLKSSDPKKVKETIKKSKIEVAFIALHGFFGEDGRLQKILEEIPLAYTGSGSKASCLAMDKAAAKGRFKKAKIAVPGHKLIKRKNCQKKGLDYPVVVKPCLCGSSYGISIVREERELVPAVKKAFKFSSRVIAEEYIEGRELTVGILKEKPLAVVEISPKKGFFNYDNKYVKGNSDFTFPAKINSSVYQQVQKSALLAHKVLGCRDFSRVDIKLKNSTPYVLEVNSVPGLTSQSLFPFSALACGISFSDLIFALLESALKRKKLKKFDWFSKRKVFNL